jgi:hypothetical protein
VKTNKNEQSYTNAIVSNPILSFQVGFTGMSDTAVSRWLPESTTTQRGLKPQYSTASSSGFAAFVYIPGFYVDSCGHDGAPL